MYKWIYALMHTPKEVCKKYGHEPRDVVETSGNGQNWTCQRCKEKGHTPEVR
ncbi:hypothetical protein ACUXLG_005608 [Ralstonia sp. 121560039-2]|jgi:hypothetical protein